MTRSWTTHGAARRPHALLLVCIVLAALACVGGVGAREPKVTTSSFANLPAKVSYFDDSSVVLWHDADAGTVYRSDNEGKTWEAVKGPRAGAAYLLIEHPYDTKQAFILSNAQEHLRTRDRGATWQHFRTPDPPAIRGGLPLDFHADAQHREYILYTGRRCVAGLPWQRSVCHDVVYYTTDAFASVHLAMEVVLHCSWAKTTPEVNVPNAAMQRVFCIAWDESTDNRAANAGTSKTRLYESDDFFQTKRLVDLGLGRDARGFMGLGASRRYLIAALQAPGATRELALYVTLDAVHWHRAHFPHGQLLHENAYTVLDGPRFHLLVDVLDAASQTGSLFLSDGSGTNFTLGLHGTQRNAQGVVDYEHLANMDGIAIANVRSEPGAHVRVKTMITHDEGSHWAYLRAPARDVDGHKVGCDVADTAQCSLHLHALVRPHNAGRVFSSAAPGLVMGVGSIGAALRPYADCDTFLSTDAGATWRMVARHPHKYEFGDQGGVLVLVPDTGATDVLRYSFDYGASWRTLRLGASVTPFVLTTIPDSTALKFLLIGSRARGTAHDAQRHVALFVDFAPVQKRKCGARDLEKWYPSGPNGPCILGHRQWYMRRRADADCVVLEKFHDPVGHEDACACTPADYECDMHFVARNGACVPDGALPVPEGACQRKGDTFLGPSGYRKVPGNTCTVPAGQRALDAPVTRACADAAPPGGAPGVPGAVQPRRFAFPAPIADVLHFRRSPHIVVRLQDGQVFQSSDDGGTWHALHLLVAHFAEKRALALVPHAHDRQRAYIVSDSQAVFYTLDGGVHWAWFTAPLPPNTFGLEVLDFHPTRPDYLLWTGSRDCGADARGAACHVEVSYSLDNGAHWKRVETYARKCAWLLDTRFRAADTRAILCERYGDKRGAQPAQHTGERALQLVLGNDLYRKQRVLFENVLGFSVFEEYLLVAEVVGAPATLQMHVSLDAERFAAVQLPPQLELAHHAFTVLDSVTRAVFLHVSTQTVQRREWGDLVKSNSNGTYYALSLQRVNRDAHGYVDFEKMQGIDGIALANVVANPDEAAVSGAKALQTRITHNDGGRWAELVPPARDALGAPYACDAVGCSLHLHNVLERPDVRMTTSTPAAAGFMLGVGNVGRALAPYRDSDTFLTRDAGFTWEEVHKDAHRWAFGDHGALLLLVDDERPTDEVLYSLDQGRKWTAIKLGERMRVLTIDAVPEESKRRFVLFGHTTHAQPRALSVFLDFAAVLPRQCVFDTNAEKSDFERWSPSEQREETCLFGARRWYWRRKRERTCFVGDDVPELPVTYETCACTDADFEWYATLPTHPAPSTTTATRRRTRVCRTPTRRVSPRTSTRSARATRPTTTATGTRRRTCARCRCRGAAAAHARTAAHSTGAPTRPSATARGGGSASCCSRACSAPRVPTGIRGAVTCPRSARCASTKTRHTATRASSSACCGTLCSASRASRGRASSRPPSGSRQCAAGARSAPSAPSRATTCSPPTRTPRCCTTTTRTSCRPHSDHVPDHAHDDSTRRGASYTKPARLLCALRMPAPWPARPRRATAAVLAACALGTIAHARPLIEAPAAAASLVPSRSADASSVPTAHSSSLALCYDLQALRSLEGHTPTGPNALVDYDGVLHDYYVYISTSIALAFIIIFIMIVAVCLRDHHAGKKKPEDDEIPLAHLSATSPELRSSTSRGGAPRDTPRHRFLRVPRRIPLALRKRRTTHMPAGSRSSSSGGASQRAAAAPSAPPSSAPSPDVTTPTHAPAAPLDTTLAELGPRSGTSLAPTPPPAAVPSLHLPPPAPAAPAPAHTPRDPLRAPLDQSDVEAVNALPIEPAQPPAYIAPPPDAQPGSSPRDDRGKGPAPPLEEAGGTDELFAHLATDDKAVLTALHSAASAPAPALDTDPLRRAPLAPPPRWGAAPSAPPIDVDDAAHPDTAPPMPLGKGKARHVSGSLQLPPTRRTPQFARFDAPTYEAPAPAPHASAKEAEAEAERAHLAALLPSAPTEWGWANDVLPTYGTAPSAPPPHADEGATQSVLGTEDDALWGTRRPSAPADEAGPSEMSAPQPSAPVLFVPEPSVPEPMAREPEPSAPPLVEPEPSAPPLAEPGLSAPASILGPVVPEIGSEPSAPELLEPAPSAPALSGSEPSAPESGPSAPASGPSGPASGSSASPLSEPVTSAASDPLPSTSSAILSPSTIPSPSAPSF